MVKTYDNGKWLYGDSWERFPIEDLDIWLCGHNRVMAADITNNDISVLVGETKIDMTYVDPPWNDSNIGAFYTKANKSDRLPFLDFVKKLVEIVKKYSPDVNYMEMGFQNLDEVSEIIKGFDGFITDVWPITYYKKHKCHLVRYSFSDDRQSSANFFGMDDDFTPDLAMISEKNIKTVMDLCTGRGLTGRTAYKNGINFIGTELNKRRLACLIDWYHNNKLSITKL